MTEWSASIQNAGSAANWKEKLKISLSDKQWSKPLEPIAIKLANGDRLSIEDGLILYQHPNISEVGMLANLVKHSRFDKQVFFNSNVHINQTNICVLACRFCAFRRSKKQSDAYAMTIDEYIKEMDKFADYVDEVHSVGGLHPDWDVDFYVDLISAAKEKYPKISIKALTAVEIKHLSIQSDISFSETL